MYRAGINKKKKDRSPEFEFIVCLAESCFSTVDINRWKQLIRKITDWSLFLDLCQEHGILAISWKAIADQSSLFPESFLENSRAIIRKIAVRNLQMSAQLLNIIDNFEKNNICVLPVKGPVLAQQVYNDISQRSFGDLDILVYPEDIRRVITLLGEIGFEAQFPGISDEFDFSKEINHFSFYNQQKRCLVEVHLNLTGYYLAHPLTLATLAPFTYSASFLGKKIRNLSVDVLLLYLCLHGMHHQWSRVEWILTVAKVSQNIQEDEWDGIWEKSCLWKCQRPLLLGLQLSRELFNIILPDAISLKIQDNPFVATLTQYTIRALDRQCKNPSFPISGIHLLFFSLLTCNNISDRCRYIFRILFTPNIKDFNALSAPANLSFLYYLYRPLRLILSAFKSRK